ncbi:MAG: hypothetical protein K8F52_01775 [Candidatus Scalindua rubra]|uniref:Uncharacterized protein n=1 Tax=Candidatus Scalindua brodae TaxID=237368 RepID=A0A0B0EN93_9BACT|nr:MAG: hypothetical protein SCABRO_02176 [Candidatus Scalindua brodae]MBZ0107371.1 hypothetical protein [Candidatus Scalindua rubra]TWU31432.1 hypothetical protein S225a_21040 [Candidatus Brocadiaceae bacterium S225]
MSNISKLINTIQTLGYKVSLEGEKIKLKFIDKDDPPKEASIIIKEIKENKAIVIEYLNNISRMENIFMDAVNEITKVSTVCAINYTQKMLPEMYEKVITAENKINSLWDEGQDIKAFSEAVIEWQETQMEYIELLNAENGVDTVVEDVYNSPNGKPGPSQGLGKEVV